MPRSLNLNQLHMKQAKMISYLLHGAENSGAGCQRLCGHFFTSWSLCVYWKVWAGWRSAGGCYAAGSAPLLKTVDSNMF